MSRLPITQILAKHQELNEKLSTTTDQAELILLSREHKQQSRKSELAGRIAAAEQIIADNESLLQDMSLDAEMRQLLTDEVLEQKTVVEREESALLTLLSPVDERDAEDVLLEIRAGAGGDESSLFAGEMYKMYSLYAANLGLKSKIISSSLGTMGGFKEVIAEIRGEGAFAALKYEGGVHRVQRVPETEKQGRVHTSTVSVAIMPLLEQDTTFKLNMDEVEIIITTSSGNGGQSVNTTYSAVRMRHNPTKIEAQSQDERDQQQNRLKCIQVLTSRVYNYYEDQRRAQEAAARKEQVGTADRSEKIRTYNFPQDRLTDHRYGQNWNQLPVIMTGGFAKVVDDINTIEAERLLANL
jgi:peptide chain release factor 1